MNPPPPSARFHWLRRFGGGFLWLCLGLATAWAVAALYLDMRVPCLRIPLAAAYGLGALVVWWRGPRQWKGAMTAGGLVLVLAWWFSLRPSNQRDWQPDVALLPWAEFSGDRVTLHNIRNCDYRTETDFDVRHYDKTLDLSHLNSVDLYLVYWGSPHIAHTMVSFGFEEGDYICISIETRKEKGESYSAIKGLFRQFELTYVVADERDLVRLRTNYRQGEEAYLYHLFATPGQARALFLEYLRRADRLRNRPEWYNALTSNCTTNIRLHARAAGGTSAPWDWRILINGHSDQMLYERGRLAAGLPFAELKQRCHINERARSAGQSPDFSKLIRVGLPGVSAATTGTN